MKLQNGLVKGVSFTRLLVYIFCFLTSIVVSVSAKTLPPHYDVSLTINTASQEISGIEVIDQPGLTDSMFKHLSLKGLEIDSIRSETGKVDFNRIGDSVTLQQNHLSRLTIWYHGKPTVGLTMKPLEIYTAFHTQGWMICDMRPRTKATLDLHIAVPDRLTVVASGHLIDSAIHRGTMTYHFREMVPVSAYLFGFACGQFRMSSQMVGNTQIRLCSQKFSDLQRDSILEITAKALRYFEKLTGKPYPFGTYTEVCTDDDNEQEVAGYCLLSNDYISSVLSQPKEDWLIIHELAHQWFGNSLTCKTWSDFWLNEGMVTFLTAEYKGVEFGKEEMDREMYLARVRYSRLIGTPKDRPIVWNGWKKPEEMSGIITYYKGALVLNYLKHLVGEKAFWAGLKAYTQKYWMASVSTTDLERELEKSSGRNFKWFFDSWVYSSKVPTLTATYSFQRDSLAVTITQDSNSFRLPMTVATETISGRSSYPIVVTTTQQTFMFPLRDSLLSLRLDDTGELPISIRTQLPIDISMYQASHEPTIFGRIEAVQALQKQASSMDSAEYDSYHELLAYLKVHDTSRLVRDISIQLLAEPAKK